MQCEDAPFSARELFAIAGEDASATAAGEEEWSCEWMVSDVLGNGVSFGNGEVQSRRGDRLLRAGDAVCDGVEVREIAQGCEIGISRKVVDETHGGQAAQRGERGVAMA